MNLKWHKIQDMHVARISPGTMQSWDHKCLFVFGGKASSIEKYDYNSDIWELLKVDCS